MAAPSTYLLQFGQMFTIFFIMLGPLRIPIEYAISTQGFDKKEKNKLCITSGLFALIGLIAVGFIGSMILVKWHIDPDTLTMAAGILLLLSALPPLIKPSKSLIREEIELTPASVAVKILISPHGLAIVIVLFSVSHDIKRSFAIMAALGLVGILNILYMIYWNPDPTKKKGLFSLLLKNTLGTLQFALSLQIIYDSLKWLKII